jgi:predicted aspartyl protease
MNFIAAVSITPMKNVLIFARAARPVLALLLALTINAANATYVEVAAVGARSTAQFVLDGVKREARLQQFTDEGLLLQKIDGDYAIFSLNGETRRMRVGETAIFDSQTQGFITHQIRADQKNKYITPALINGGNVQAEIDRSLDLIVIPAIDADRLGIPYKEKPAQSFRVPKETVKEMKDGKEVKTIVEPKDKDGKPAMYKTYFIALNSIRVGAVDVYGVRAVVSEKPGLTTTMIGREFLKQASPNWSNRVLTLIKR